MLKINNLHVKYGMVQVLHDVSIHIPKGKLISIIGSNGVGKSTLLRSVSGLVQSASGEIILDGENIEKLKAHEIVKRGVAHVPEGRILFNRLTVFENLQLGAYTKNYTPQEFNEVLEQVYSLFPILKERAKQQAGTFSGGQQQMLAIARGLMLKPKLLMLDEPSLGLMPSLVTQVFEVLGDIKNEGLSILLVEQNVQEALELADYAYVLQTGRIVMEGSGKELLDNDEIRNAYLGL